MDSRPVSALAIDCSKNTWVRAELRLFVATTTDTAMISSIAAVTPMTNTSPMPRSSRQPEARRVPPSSRPRPILTIITPYPAFRSRLEKVSVRVLTPPEVLAS